ncbi:hypothetical protein OS493_019594 [Desmophyllum pertusum]|uniref:SAP domain-containing protein n=1 Tax=Desmophyllum pertusum TaxID=174260 RepID=A0A9W9ZBU4_9CNID|nr:hypothetical protein OS493_019594 [Desmophyllum pertusum]
MAANASDSEIPKQDDLSLKSVQQLRGLLKEKGLSTSGKKNVLIERRNAKVLQGDIDALIRTISELSENWNNKVKIQIRIERLSEYRMSYLQLRNRIISLLADEEIEDELHSWRELLDMIDKAVDAAHEYLNKESNLEDQSSKGSVHKSHKDSHQPSNLKLPRIELPKFNVLTGNALQTIEGFEVTGANYQPAVEMSQTQMDAKAVANASSLRDLHDTFINRTRALEALGEIPMSHGCMLLPMFETKLPSELLEKWELEFADTPEDEIDLELFFKFLNRQVVSKEAGERNLQNNS